MPSNNKVNNKSTTTRTNRVDKSHPRSPATGATATSNSRRATTGRKIESGKISYEVAQYNEPGSSQYEEEPVQYLQDESFYTGVPTYLTYHDLQQSNESISSSMIPQSNSPTVVANTNKSNSLMDHYTSHQHHQKHYNNHHHHHHHHQHHQRMAQSNGYNHYYHIAGTSAKKDKVAPTSTSKTNLYIRGLDENTTDKDLYEMCQKYGEIKSTKAIIDKETNKCKGYGFVDFKSLEDAQFALNELKKEKKDVQLAKQREQDPTNLYFANLPPDVNEDMLNTMLKSKFNANIVSSRIMRERTGASKCVGFARIEDDQLCETIVQELNNRPMPDYNSNQNRIILVKLADSWGPMSPGGGNKLNESTNSLNVISSSSSKPSHKMNGGVDGIMNKSGLLVNTNNQHINNNNMNDSNNNNYAMDNLNYSYPHHIHHQPHPYHHAQYMDQYYSYPMHYVDGGYHQAPSTTPLGNATGPYMNPGMVRNMPMQMPTSGNGASSQAPLPPTQTQQSTGVQSGSQSTTNGPAASQPPVHPVHHTSSTNPMIPQYYGLQAAPPPNIYNTMAPLQQPAQVPAPQQVPPSQQYYYMPQGMPTHHLIYPQHHHQHHQHHQIKSNEMNNKHNEANTSPVSVTDAAPVSSNEQPNLSNQFSELNIKSSEQTNS